MNFLGIILAIVSIIVSIGSFGYFIKISFIDGENDIDWYKDYFKILGIAFIIALIAAGFGLSVGSGFSRILSFISIIVMFIQFITYFVRSNQIR